MKENFKKKILDNGMTVLFEKRDLPVVSVAFAVRQGGENEIEDEKGISHFIEHMLYKGTKNRTSKQIAEEIEKNGGELNGFTSETMTAYWCKMPSDNLTIALNVLSDLVKNPKFDEKELNKERQVIFEEIKMYQDNPSAHCLIKIHECLFEKPFGIPLIGTYETMNSIDRKKIIEKFNAVYTPNNMILLVVGNADFDKIVDFAEKNFQKNSGKITIPKIKPKNEIKIETRKGIDQANLVFAYHIPYSDNKLSYAAEVLSCFMAEGMSSKLFEEIREKRNLAYSIHGGSESQKNFAFNFIAVGTTKENVEKVKEIILKEFENLCKNFSEKDLSEIKKQLIGNYKISMEDSKTQMVNILDYEIKGKAEDFYDFEKNISDVKLEDVKKLANIKKYSFFALTPE